MNALFISSLFICLHAAPTLATSSPQCKAVSFQVTGSAQNRNITGIPTSELAALVAFYETAPVVTATGPQTLAGTYCQPTTKNANNGKIQMFFSSILSDRSGWMAQGGVGLDFPPYQEQMYSWTDYANAKGYPTLALDRLGNGKSSHPDPILVVQAPYEIALYNNLAQQVRKGTTGQLSQSYSHLIYVGNSYGSQLGAGMAGSHPDAYDEFILTGFTYDFQQDFAGVSLTIPAPAAVVDPARFGTLSPGYLTSSSETGRTNTFFGSKAQVAYDDTVAHLFFQRKDVVSLGQFVSVYALTYNAPSFTGRVFDLNGEEDQATCGPGSPVIGPAMCGPQLQQTGALFPVAQYNYKSVDKTGHAIQLHLSSQKVYDLAHRFLAGESFKGGAPA